MEKLQIQKETETLYFGRVEGVKRIFHTQKPFDERYDVHYDRARDVETLVVADEDKNIEQYYLFNGHYCDLEDLTLLYRCIKEEGFYLSLNNDVERIAAEGIDYDVPKTKEENLEIEIE